MTTRRPFVGGNWKMNKTRAEAVELAAAVGARAAGLGAVEVAVFPAFVHLDAVVGELDGGAVRVGAQDVFYEAQGAFTGEVSAAMVLDVGASMAIVGHSERRHVIGESDEVAGRKCAAAVAGMLGCVLCVGETLEQRDKGQTDAVNERQLRAALKCVAPEQVDRLVIAYEPVWAIGTGKTATPEDAQNAHRAIRAVVADIYDHAVADRTRIVYGGSMKPDNASALVGQPDVDGGLIGGASLDANDFLAICEAAAKAPASA